MHRLRVFNKHLQRAWLVLLGFPGMLKPLTKPVLISTTAIILTGFTFYPDLIIPLHKHILTPLDAPALYDSQQNDNNGDDQEHVNESAQCVRGD